MPNVNQFAMQLLKQKMAQNPSLSANPMARELMNILESGDEKRGQEMAKNLCQSYGVSQTDALRDARSFFGF